MRAWLEAAQLAGLVLDPGSGSLDRADVLVRDERIVPVGPVWSAGTSWTAAAVCSSPA